MPLWLKDLGNPERKAHTEMQSGMIPPSSYKITQVMYAELAGVISRKGLESQTKNL